ncbi:MAG: Lrp/AsnC family transcriptional regulator [Desulfobacterales bacterium CG07_land_8_20_14_0_80_52_14]|nr:MAG: AsnC family protein [Desulfobacterales bacterium CG23_combo_of_CG06-09_8_20_14_all_52_9]PIU50415.1 MAG: Lrp/AsnC family transcriptional regulator [Desulfobacterales bacterium CG07_land_8_20_14_0_80_52_14]
MEPIDKAILNRIQSDFPITKRPFRSIGKDVNLPEEEVLKRIIRLKENGIIRRIGGNFVPEKLGFVSTLCAARVPEDRIKAFAEWVNRYPGVTHNYLRDNPYNMWFTFIAPSVEEIQERLKEISQATGITDILNLPATRVFKIRAHFDV